MVFWFKYTAKAWVAAIGAFVTAFVVEYMSSPTAHEVIGEMVQNGFNWQSASVRGFISGAILWVLTYWVRNAKVENDPRNDGQGQGAGVADSGNSGASGGEPSGLDGLGHKP